MKKRRWIGVLAVLFMVTGVLAIAVGAWAVLTPPAAPVGAGETTTTTTAPDTTPADTAPVNTPLTDEQKVQYNTEIRESLFHGIWKLLDIHCREMQYDMNYLASVENRSSFAWEVMVDDRSVPREREVWIDREGATGEMAVKQEDYAAIYANLFDETVDLQALLQARPRFELYEDRIYGTHVTGWGADPFVIKTTGFGYNDATGLYELKADFLTKVQEREDSGWYDVDYDNYIFPYRDPAILEYPDEMIYAKMTMEFAKGEDGYILKSLQFARP